MHTDQRRAFSEFEIGHVIAVDTKRLHGGPLGWRPVRRRARHRLVGAVAFEHKLVNLGEDLLFPRGNRQFEFNGIAVENRAGALPIAHADSIQRLFPAVLLGTQREVTALAKVERAKMDAHLAWLAGRLDRRAKGHSFIR